MPTTVLFIAGMGRSGTTLLERVLGSLPGTACIGETVHGWERGVHGNELCGCGLPFHACAFWQSVGKAGFDGWDRVDLARIRQLREAVDRVRRVPRLVASRPGSAVDALRAEYAGYFGRLYRAVAETAGAEVVIDSSKQASLPHVLCREPDIDLRVLHVVRDARAVCHAWTKSVRRPESQDPDAEMPRYTPRDMAVQWSLHNATVELMRARGVPTLRVRYEDFVASPAPTVERIARFASVPALAGLGFLHGDTVTLGESHTVAGNPMRFVQGEVELRRDDAWRRSMTRSQQLTVTALTLPMLRYYHYGLAA